MPVGDVHSKERGSGARFNDNKPDFSLLPLTTLEDELRVWMYGKEKYAAWNWAKGMPWSVPFACLMRHMAAWQRGEELDQESGLPHLAHAMCNLRMLTLYSRTYPEGDDRPKKYFMPQESPPEQEPQQKLSGEQENLVTAEIPDHLAPEPAPGGDLTRQQLKGILSLYEDCPASEFVEGFEVQELRRLCNTALRAAQLEESLRQMQEHLGAKKRCDFPEHAAAPHQSEPQASYSPMRVVRGDAPSTSQSAAPSQSPPEHDIVDCLRIAAGGNECSLWAMAADHIEQLERELAAAYERVAQFVETHTGYPDPLIADKVIVIPTLTHAYQWQKPMAAAIRALAAQESPPEQEQVRESGETPDLEARKVRERDPAPGGDLTREEIEHIMPPSIDAKVRPNAKESTVAITASELRSLCNMALRIEQLQRELIQLQHELATWFHEPAPDAALSNPHRASEPGGDLTREEIWHWFAWKVRSSDTAIKIRSMALRCEEAERELANALALNEQLNAMRNNEYARAEQDERDLAVAQQDVERLRSALGQARSCISKFVIPGKNRDFTLRVVNAVIACIDAAKGA